MPTPYDLTGDKDSLIEAVKQIQVDISELPDPEDSEEDSEDSEGEVIEKAPTMVELQQASRKTFNNFKKAEEAKK